MAVIAMVIGNINNATTFVPQRIRKKHLWLVALRSMRLINDTCFPNVLVRV